MGSHFYGVLPSMFAFIFAFFPYKKFSFYVHSILGTLIIALTLGWMIPLLLVGMYMGYGQRGIDAAIKAWFGAVFIGGSVILVLLGVGSRIFQQNEKIKSKLIINMKKAHLYLGYFLIIISKASVLIGYWRTWHLFFWIVLGWQTFTLILFIIKKLSFKTLESLVVDEQIKIFNKSTQLISIQRLQMSFLNYVIFSDYVYNVDLLRTAHPAGYQIIQKVRGRQIDRFLYGMYSAQQVPEIAPYSHSQKSLQLIGKPMFKLDIPQIYTNIPQQTSVSVQCRQVLSSVSGIYLVRLQPINKNDKFLFKGYSDVRQLGQYFSVTINEKTTRLYTSVHFLNPSNTRLLSKILKYPDIISDIILKFNKASKCDSQQQNISTSSTEAIFTTHNACSKQFLQVNQVENTIQSIPLLIKKYNKGKLTSQLLDNKFKGSIIMSCPKGLGVQLNKVKHGKIIIIVGGTGIYPFLDLVDLLFKQHLINQGHKLTNQIKELNPILKQDPFKYYTFHLMAAFKSVNDIPMISLLQIAELCQQTKGFTALFKFSQKQSTFKDKYPQIKITQQRFHKIITKDAKISKPQKIWICGPPAMNTQTVNTLLENGFNKQDFLLI